MKTARSQRPSDKSQPMANDDPPDWKRNQNDQRMPGCRLIKHIISHPHPWNLGDLKISNLGQPYFADMISPGLNIYV
ncbi:hypothetical protein HYFRA_00003030 [Hymenoscyphus fraxineus]|uniref:Uncharacterized protein n=1 Tax=Hymenoscyphus fraxineus TaxID=746836 RepID=A0A9N9KNY6_9HELO|nr:hypothetical protein HYFRA_00003030 [Hymenoscyphus fraxineus]